MVVNTVLSMMAYDYPTEKLSEYLSDDAASDVNFYALLEAFNFAKHWLPFCKRFKVEPTSPALGFSQWKSYSSRRDHHTILQILLDKKDPNSKDVDGSVLPTLVYLAREKRPNYHHNFKAGATNATDKGIIKD
ncbi:hypothetical protein L6164_029521 [Bauhinia variegata]|uniref:Uncharacterized protein n=1 Tax=Bauhinia variegata TaxID=167791 RepID=A0ACB9L924_BAUVA|nr:hypothetical protein L6164_029521 [Bauhinia variegata]